jgi:phage shock protein PspC (stress-responsive transcriptional regulator)
MNGNRLYRSTSEAMVGGVASGLGNYFKIDPTIARIAFVVLTFFTGGGFILAYLAMWLLIPTAGSTATSAGEIVRENLDDMGARVRGGFGGHAGSAPTNGSNGNGNPGGMPNGAPNGGPTNGGSGAQLNAGAHPRYGMLPVILIAVGGFFLLAKMGLFHPGFWGAWWPLVLIGVGLCLLTRRRA